MYKFFNLKNNHIKKNTSSRVIIKKTFKMIEMCFIVCSALFGISFPFDIMTRAFVEVRTF